MTTLIATCDACGNAVSTRGCLWVDLDAAMANARAVQAWRDHHPGAVTVEELLELPPAVTWQVHHDACDPDPEALAYRIDISQIDTSGALLNWTAHLMSKRWLKDTDWDDLIRDAAAGTGRRLRMLAERAA